MYMLAIILLSAVILTVYFGASIHLPVVLTLLGVAWLSGTRHPVWVFFVKGIKAAFMCVIISFCLVTIVQMLRFKRGNADPAAGVAHPVMAHFPNDNAKASPFDVILQCVAETTTSNDWTKDTWADMRLESSLSALLDRLQEITKKKNLELPAKFGSVRPAISPDGSKITNLRNSLYVTKRGKVSDANNSIILADESIEVSWATNCLIIARGTVDVSHGRGNLIIAGYFAHTSHDRSSVLIAGAVVDVSHSNDTFVCAPHAAKVSFSTNGIFINSPNRNISWVYNATYLTDDSNTLPTVFTEHPMIDKLKVTRIVSGDSGDSGNGAYVASTHAGVIRLGHDIPNATDDLKGWKLVVVREGFALFAKDGQYAGTYIVPRN